MSKIQGIAKRPGTAPYVTNISNTLENLQRFVGGWIETVSFPEDGVVIVCDEEGSYLKALSKAELIAMIKEM